jgi:hypothetical protein
MKKVTKLFLTVVLISTVNEIYSQVAGVSASKLGTVCATCVPAAHIEFEPSYSVSQTNGFWSNNSDFIKLNNDSVIFESDLAFRFSYGVTNDFEAGVFVPVNGENISGGAKYHIKNKFINLALIGGINVPLTNYSDLINEGIPTSAAAGIVISKNFCDEIGFDVHLQTQKYFKRNAILPVSEIFVASDFGYYFTDKIQFVSGFDYYRAKYSAGSASSFSVNPGFTFERAENFILVINYSLNLFGRNTTKTNTFGFALTIMIN